MTQAYVYKWTHLPTLKWYVGSRYKTGCHPGDGYICSSKIVKPLIKANPEQWSREVIAVGNELEMRQLEFTILNLFDAATDSRSFNRTNGFKNPNKSYHSVESSNKMKEAAKRRNANEIYQLNREAMFSSESWQHNHAQAALKLSQNPDWVANQKLAGKKRNKNIKEWYNCFVEGNDKAVKKKHENGTYEVWKDKMDAWRQTPEGQEHLIKKSILTQEMGKRNSRTVETLNDGEFPSVTLAAEYYGIGKSTMSGRIKDHNDLYWFKDLGPGVAKRKKINK